MKPGPGGDDPPHVVDAGRFGGLSRLGGILALGAIAWVVWQVYRQGWIVPPGATAGRLLLTVAAGALIYGCLSWLQASAWWWLTGIYGLRKSFWVTTAVWARTQVAKYLPSNLMHYVGRQMMGRKIGLRHEALFAAHLLELVSMLVAAACIGVGGALVTRSQTLASVSLPTLASLILGGVIVWPLADRILRRIPATAERMASLPRLSVTEILRLMSLPFLFHAAFLIGTGFVLLLLFSSGWPEGSADPSNVIWIYALSWAAGTLTPGAPGGLGVREAVLTLGLEGSLGVEAAALALTLRLVTVLGDLVAFGFGWAVPLAIREAPSRSA